MLLTLLRVRIASLFSGSFNEKNRKRTLPILLGLAALMLFLALFFSVLVGFVFGVLASPLAAASAEHVYFSIAGTVALLLMVFGSVVFTQNQLYAANDNELLLAMPISPRTILLSRLLLLLLVNCAFGAIVALPALIVWPIFGDATFLGMLTAIIGFLTLPVLALSVSCLLGYLVAKISAKIRRKSLVAVLLALFFLGVYFPAVNFLEAALADLDSVSIAPVVDFVESVWPMAALGRALSGDFFACAVLVLLTAAVAYAVLTWLSRTFLTTVVDKRGAPRVEFREDVAKEKSVLWALTVREVRHLVSSSGYMINAGLGLVFALVLPLLILFGGDAVNEILPFVSNAFAPIAMGATVLCFSMVIFSACTVSLEGRTLWIVRTAPIPTRTILLSKAFYHLLLTAPVAVVATVLYTVILTIPVYEAILVLIGVLAYLVFGAFFGLFANLICPKLEWKNELVPIKQGMATLLGMLGGFLGGIAGALPALILSFIIPAWSAILLGIAIYGVLAVGAVVLVLSVGVRRFEAL